MASETVTMTLQEFARRVGRPYHSCWRLLADGKLRAVREDGRWRIPVEEVERFKKPCAVEVSA